MSFSRFGVLLAAACAAVFLSLSAHAEDRSKPFMSERAIEIVDYAIESGAEELLEQSARSERVSPGPAGRIIINNAFEVDPNDYARTYQENEFLADGRYKGKPMLIRAITQRKTYSVNSDGELLGFEGGYAGILINTESSLLPITAVGSAGSPPLLNGAARLGNSDDVKVTLLCIGSGVQGRHPALRGCRTLSSHLSSSTDQMKRETRDAELWYAALFAFGEDRFAFRTREMNLLRLKAEYLIAQPGNCQKGFLDMCLLDINSLGKEDDGFLKWIDEHLRGEGRSLLDARIGF